MRPTLQNRSTLKKDKLLQGAQISRDIDRSGQRLPSDEQSGCPFSGNRCPGLRSETILTLTRVGASAFGIDQGVWPVSCFRFPKIV